MATENNQPAWEACKENVLPIKRGRSAKGLSESLQKTSDSTSIDKLREKLFEDTIIAAGKSSPKELLEAYILYFKWTRDAYPSSAEKALGLLEKCTCELKDEADLKNDQRFVKMWIEYADMVRTPGEIFSFMQSKKIGEKVALFWIAWAFVAEKVLNFKLTDQIFQKGMRRQAEPKDMLAKRYQQFQRRLARYYLNNIDTDNDIVSTDTPSVPARNTLSTISNNQGNNQGNNQLNNQGGLGAQVNNENNGRERRVFGGLSAAQATSGLRSAPVSTTRTPHTAPISVNTARTSHTTGTSSTVQDAAPVRSSNSTFHIFSDSAPGPGSELLALTENENWRSLDTQANKRKENNVPVSIWTEGPLQPPSRSAPAAPPASTALVPMVNIFIDEAFQNNEDEEGNGGKEDKKEGSKNEIHGGLKLRQHLEGTAESLTSRIASNPLARHKLEAHTQPEPSNPTSTATSTRDARATTTETKTEMRKEIKPEIRNDFKIETKVEVKNDVKSENPTKTVISSGIKIFEEFNSPKKTITKIAEKKITNPAMSAFSIFSENEPVKKVEKREDRKEEKRDERRVVERVEKKEGFQIFEQMERVEKKVADRVEKKEERKEDKRENNGERIVKKEEIKEEKHQSELDDLLSEMGILDSEDGTINTRLARKDIDLMFCSPSSVNMSANKGKNDDYDKQRPAYNSFNFYKPSGNEGCEKDSNSYSNSSNNNNNHSSDNNNNNNNNHHHDTDRRQSESFLMGGENTNTLEFSTSDLSVIKENANEDYSIFGQLNSPPGKFLSFRTTTKKSEKIKNKKMSSENDENGGRFEIYNDNKRSDVPAFSIYTDNNENNHDNYENENEYRIYKNQGRNSELDSRGRNLNRDSGSLYVSSASSNSNHSESSDISHN